MTPSWIFVTISCVLWQCTLGNPNRPNIVFIVADDLGWNDVGFTGQSDLQTPNIDALAYHGRILTQHYTTSSCTPSRSALLTGKYPIRTGMQGYPLLPTEPRGLPLDQKLLPQYLKDLGYQTHLLGKWHLGHYKKKYTPTERGFDSHFGFYNGHVDYFNHTITFDNRTYNDLWRNAIPVEADRGKYITDLLTDEAVKLIEEAASSPRGKRSLSKFTKFIGLKTRASSGPLFLLISHATPHASSPIYGENDLQHNEKDLARFSYITNERRRKYAAMVWSLDKSVGKVVRTLADNGMLNNTIIVFTSDNGAPLEVFGNEGSNYPLRGLKFSNWEGGVRTPAFIWSLNLQSKSEGVSSQLFNSVDWLPTLYAAAGGDTKRDLSGLDGTNQWSALSKEPNNKKYAVRREMLINIDEVLNLKAIRYRQWKLISGVYPKVSLDKWYTDYRNATVAREFAMSEIAVCLVEKVIKANLNTAPLTEERVKSLRAQVKVNCAQSQVSEVCTPKDTPCLYDLEADPCEQNDLLSKNPDIVAMMTAKLETYMELLKPQINAPLRKDLTGDYDSDWGAKARTLQYLQAKIGSLSSGHVTTSLTLAAHLMLLSVLLLV